MYDNALQGPLPGILGCVKQLVIIDCRFNQFSGALPEGMFLLKGLLSLTAEANELAA